MPIDPKLFDDTATKDEHRAADRALRKRGDLDEKALLAGLRHASAAGRERAAAALASARVLNSQPESLGAALAELARDQSEAGPRLLGLLSVMKGVGGLERVPLPVLLRLREAHAEVVSHNGLPSVLSAWCEAQGAVPREIVEWVLEIRAERMEHPTLDKLAAWLAPSAAGFCDLAEWEASARAVAGDDEMDFEGIDDARRALAHGGAPARAAFADARRGEHPPRVRAVLDEWAAALEVQS